MLIDDGVTPGNEARGYVLRRLLRRVVRSMRLLGVDEPSFAELFPVSRDAMQDSYPEVASRLRPDLRHRVRRGGGVPRAPSPRARRSSTSRSSKARSRVGQHALSGDRAFQLHDTYGFPIDLTLEMAAEQGLEVDEAGFRTLMQEQRDRAKADAKAKKGSGGQHRGLHPSCGPRGETPFTGFDDPGAGVHGPRHRGRRRARRGGAARRRGRGRADRDPVLRRVRRPVRRPRRDRHRRRAAARGASTCSGRSRAWSCTRSRSARASCGPVRRVQAVVDGDWRLGACQAHSATHVIHAALHADPRPDRAAGGLVQPARLHAARLLAGATGVDRGPARPRSRSSANEAIRADLDVSATPDAAGRGQGARRAWRCSARCTATSSGWSTWATAGRASCAPAPTSRSRPRSGCSRSTRESSVGSGIRRVEAFVGIEAFQHLAKERSLVHGPDRHAQGAARPARPTGWREMVAQLKEAEREIAALKSANLLAAGRADRGQGPRHVGRRLHRAPRRRRRRQRPALAGARGARPGRRPGRRWSRVVGGTAGQAGAW